MPGRTTAPHGRSSSRYARALAAAVVATAALVTAANAVPAHATDPRPTPAVSEGRVRGG
ncbi:hypothetical protein ACIBBD_08040 [Streptomyces sp. NPDC051315]|uniref:hypothetical protein n=1 Tax=Streptomyces sp. NPDC051315 TaxID=3365650 RepID=UPI0037B37AF7